MIDREYEDITKFVDQAIQHFSPVADPANEYRFRLRFWRPG